MQFYYLKTIKKLGILGCISYFKTKFYRTKFTYIYKNKNLKKINFDIFKFKQKDFVSKILNSEKFQNSLHPKYKNKFYILKQADLACSNCFDLLGSGPKCFEKNNINWQHDFKLNLNLKDYNFDIKIPWELSRFQQIYFLGRAYQITNNQKYAQTFYDQVLDWLDKNPCFSGVNWTCPMEAAIRAINFIWGFYFFKDSQILDDNFNQKLINSLYYHAIYLKNNWENWGQTNNHYLSDLIGYFYLCCFFDFLKNFENQKLKIFKKILKEFDKQIFPDSTSYEGSTSYHKLVTEIFLHFYLLCKIENLDLNESFIQKFEKMQNFISNCSDQKNNFVQIGDNDSGKILTNFFVINTKKPSINFFHYPNFGLSIIKAQNTHLTFRHPTFNIKQPSGHFHHDSLSITLSVNGQPIFVDPGSYIYTANPEWRKFMQSSGNHNSFFIKNNQETNFVPKDLFQLSKETQKDTALIKKINNLIIIKNYYQVKLPNNLISRFYRKIIFKENFLVIKDWVENLNIATPCYWNFLFSPKLKILRKDKNKFLIKKKKSITQENIENSKNFLIMLKSNINFEPKTGYYSPSYGKIKSCTKLESSTNFVKNQKIIYHKILIK
ncbi:MAG: heparinase II/III family protein [Candidatus Babeliales bacterium]